MELILFYVETSLSDIFVAIGNSLFYVQRIPSSCVETTLNSSTIRDVSMNCFTFDWNQITYLTTNYSTYINPTTNQTFYAQIAALTVLGMIDNY